MRIDKAPIQLKDADEANKLLSDYARVFDCVRLVDGKSISDDKKIDAVYSSIGSSDCAHITGKLADYRNCVVKRAMASESSAT